MNTSTRSPVTGAVLKWIAIITMLIDHIGSAIIGPLRSTLPSAYAGTAAVFRKIYPYIRSVGRIAFPIFCFLLVEGFLHTRDKWLYARRLLIFALISEIPFDYATSSRMPAWNHQNVYFTLFIGLMVMIGMSAFEYRACENRIDPYINLFMQFLIAAAGLLTAKVLYTDYGYKGVFLIEVLYFLRSDHRIQTIFGAITISWEATGPLAFLPIWFYNGERGRQPKAFFYWFYPVHLMILGILRHNILPALF